MSLSATGRQRKPDLMITLYKKRIIYLLSIFFISSVIPPASPAFAQEKEVINFSNAKNHWTVLGGYSESHPGLGDTDHRVQSIDMVVQYGHFLTDETGKSWYRGRHELIVEFPFSAVYEPEHAVMAGISFLASWDFTASKTMVPYIFAGGGFVYTDLNVDGLGSDYNGNYQGGVGAHYHIKDNMTLTLNYRLHHISNADTASPNEPLNSSKFYMGLTFLH